MTTTPRNINELSENRGEFPSALHDLMRAGSARIALLTSLSLGAMVIPAQTTAEDIRLAVDSSGGRVAGIFDGIPTTAEEMQESMERRGLISEVSRVRQNGIEYYGPYLEEFNALDEEGQYQVALAIYPDNAHGGPDLSDEYVELVRNLRVPEEMIDAVLEEARESGADEDWDIPAFEEALFQLREEGNTGADTLGDLISFSPNATSQLYIVVVSLVAEQRLVDAQGRLVDAQGRLVDAQGRLVDAQGRLLQQQEATQAGREALEAITD